MKCWDSGREEFFTGDVTFEILHHGGYAESLQVVKGILKFRQVGSLISPYHGHIVSRVWGVKSPESELT